MGAASGFDFEFTINSTSARTAFLTVNFSTWHVDQDLQVTISSSDNNSVPVSVPVHLTFGYWNQM